MFLSILAHEKGYRQVTTIFNQSLQTICQFFKEVLRAVFVALSKHMIRSCPNYNDGASIHCFRIASALLTEHVRIVLLHHEHVNFIGRKGVSTQNLLSECDFNLYFTFVLAGYTRSRQNV